MNDLNTLFRDATKDAPPELIDPGSLVRAGRSRVRHRRMVAGVAVAAVVTVVGGAPLLIDAPDRAAHPTAQPGETLTLADATPAQSDVDYDVVATFTAHSTDSSLEGEFVRGVLADGTVVVQSYPRGADAASRITMVDGDTSRPVDAPRSLGNYLGATATAAVFGAQANGVWTLDLTDLTWAETLQGQDFDTNTPAQPLSATSERPTVIHLARAAADGDTRAIFAATLGERTASQLAKGGDVAAYGRHVAWTASYDAPNDHVVVRDDATGTTTSFDPGTGSCDQKGLGLTAERVVVMVNCADVGDEQTETDVVDRVDVFDLTGKAIARITGTDLGPVRMTERYLTISSWNERDAGTYTYDLGTGRFLKVEGTMSGLAGAGTGSGATLVWEKRLDGDSGATYVVAQMR